MIEENLIQMKNGIIINNDVSAKNIKCVKKIFWVLLDIVAKMGKYRASIIDNSVITCNEIIEMKEIKTIPRIKICKTKKCLYFTYLVIKYYSIIDSF